MIQRAVVQFDVVGFHCWPEAPAHRDYLSTTHRHRFYFRVAVDVFHADRELEFHDLLDFCKAHVPAAESDWGRDSCEEAATKLGVAIRNKYGAARAVTVSCFEDNEVGAECIFLAYKE
jgi:hypothetical protein